MYWVKNLLHARRGSMTDGTEELNDRIHTQHSMTTAAEVGLIRKKMPDLPARSNAAELQKLLEAAIWMRTSIPEFAKETFPLQDFVRAAQMTI